MIYFTNTNLFCKAWSCHWHFCQQFVPKQKLEDKSIINCSVSLSVTPHGSSFGWGGFICGPNCCRVEGNKKKQVFSQIINAMTKMIYLFNFIVILRVMLGPGKGNDTILKICFLNDESNETKCILHTVCYCLNLPNLSECFY